VIIWLTSYPRSGNTYARIVWRYCFGLKTFSAHDDDRAVTSEELHEVISGAEKNIPSDDDINLIKTHRLVPYKRHPAIYLVRDGRSTIVSFSHHMGIPITGAISGYQWFSDWSTHIRRWARRAEKPYLIRFEDLVTSDDPGSLFDPFLEQLQFPMKRQFGRPCTFDELHERNPTFFRRGKLDSWRDEMTKQQQDHFWARHGATMEFLGYRKDGTYGDLPEL